MKRYQLASVASPSIEFECGGHVVHSTVIKNTQKNPNFDQPLFFFDVVSVQQYELRAFTLKCTITFFPKLISFLRSCCLVKFCLYLLVQDRIAVCTICLTFVFALWWQTKVSTKHE